MRHNILLVIRSQNNNFTSHSHLRFLFITGLDSKVAKKNVLNIISPVKICFRVHKTMNLETNLSSKCWSGFHSQRRMWRHFPLFYYGGVKLLPNWLDTQIQYINSNYILLLPLFMHQKLSIYTSPYLRPITIKHVTWKISNTWPN